MCLLLESVVEFFLLQVAFRLLCFKATLTSFSVQELTHGDSNTNQNKFMLTEMVEAITLLCHFHAFSSFVSGCGMVNEPTGSTSGGTLRTVEPVNPVSDQKDAPEGQGSGPTHSGDGQTLVPDILNKMKDLQNQQEDLELAELARR